MLPMVAAIDPDPLHPSIPNRSSQQKRKDKTRGGGGGHGCRPSTGNSLRIAAAAYPRWVMFSPSCNAEVDVSYSTADDDASTLAAACTSTGDRIGVSLRLAAPPAESRIRVHFPDGITHGLTATIVAAHGDSVLIEIHMLNMGYSANSKADYFVYSAGAAAVDDPSRPPSLSLLPPCYLAEPVFNDDGCSENTAPKLRVLDHRATGLLRCGENELVVAELMTMYVSHDGQLTAQLLRLCSGEWSVVQAPAISVGVGNDEAVLAPCGGANKVIPVGDDLLGFVDLFGGLMFCNAFDETPVLRHVPLPIDAMEPFYGPRSSRNVCVTEGGSTVKFINIFPRCCCGGAGSSHYQHSYRTYTIATWTLNMDDLVCAMDGTVDATELWALDGYEGVYRVPPVHPIASMDDPHVISVVVCERYIDKQGDCMVWLVMLDTRSKTLLSVCPRFDVMWWDFVDKPMIPSRVSDYFNVHPSSGNMGIERPDVVNELQTEDASNNIEESSSSISSIMPVQALKAASPSVIFAALEQIAGLADEDLLKAYRILCHDSNGRRFESLLGLPMSLRKQWDLLEIKATEACSVSSACTADI